MLTKDVCVPTAQHEADFQVGSQLSQISIRISIVQLLLASGPCQMRQKCSLQGGIAESVQQSSIHSRYAFIGRSMEFSCMEGLALPVMHAAGLCHLSHFWPKRSVVGCECWRNRARYTLHHRQRGFTHASHMHAVCSSQA